MYSCNYEPILSRLTLILNSKKRTFLLAGGNKISNKTRFFLKGGKGPHLSSHPLTPTPVLGARRWAGRRWKEGQVLSSSHQKLNFCQTNNELRPKFDQA